MKALRCQFLIILAIIATSSIAMITYGQSKTPYLRKSQKAKKPSFWFGLITDKSRSAKGHNYLVMGLAGGKYGKLGSKSNPFSTMFLGRPRFSPPGTPSNPWVMAELDMPGKNNPPGYIFVGQGFAGHPQNPQPYLVVGLGTPYTAQPGSANNPLLIMDPRGSRFASFHTLPQRHGNHFVMLQGSRNVLSNQLNIPSRRGGSQTAQTLNLNSGHSVEVRSNVEFEKVVRSLHRAHRGNDIDGRLEPVDYRTAAQIALFRATTISTTNPVSINGDVLRRAYQEEEAILQLHRQQMAEFHARIRQQNREIKRLRREIDEQNRIANESENRARETNAGTGTETGGGGTETGGSEAGGSEVGGSEAGGSEAGGGTETDDGTEAETETNGQGGEESSQDRNSKSTERIDGFIVNVYRDSEGNEFHMEFIRDDQPDGPPSNGNSSYPDPTRSPTGPLPRR